MGNIFQSIVNMVNKGYRYAKFLSGGTPVFSQFGKNIYASDVVQMAIDVIATECSKLQMQHIRTNPNGTQDTPDGGLKYLLGFAPNELMTPKDFLEKIIWQLYLNYNCFIYPTYEIKQNGKIEYTGFYPLDPSGVTYLQDSSDTVYIEFGFRNGDKVTIPYSDIIHLRKKFSVNDVMGGGLNGQPDNTALLKVLEINDTVLQGIDKGVKTSMQIRGIININTMMNTEKKDAEREKFEKSLTNNESGLLAVDLKGDYIPLKVDPKMVDKSTLDFLQNKVLNYYGVSVPILSGDYNDEQYQAFYEKTLEPLVISLSQAFTKALFTKLEIARGNRIAIYQRNMMYLSSKAKMELLKIAGEQGLLDDNQKLAIIGYPPIEGGERRTQSLNFMNRDIIDEYQLKSADSKKERKN